MPPPPHADRARAARDSPSRAAPMVRGEHRLPVRRAQQHTHRQRRIGRALPGQQIGPDARFQLPRHEPGFIAESAVRAEYRQREQHAPPRWRSPACAAGARTIHSPSRVHPLLTLRRWPRIAFARAKVRSACRAAPGKPATRSAAASTDTSTTKAPPMPTLRVSKTGLNSSPSNPMATVEPDHRMVVPGLGHRLRHRLEHR